MDRYLKADAHIINPKRAQEGSYKIKGLIGTGSSCAVYYAEFINDSSVVTEHLLKEYNPKSIKLERAENGSLVHSGSVDAAFKAGLSRFEGGYNIQLEVRRNSDTKNSTSNIQDIFDANGTRYIDMTVMSGKTYEKVEEKTLQDLLRRIVAITKVVGNYHEKGLLHLDIKPDNIFTIPETAELVVMFDFDSVIKKKDVVDAAFLSYTQSWAAQEQILPYRRNRICEATDIFAIGEILFYKLVGRHSYPHERTTFASYSFDSSSKLLEGVNPRIFPLLSEIFQHTICNVVGKRYQNTSELLEKLEEALLLADPRKPFLQHHLPLEASFFIGRDAELRELDERLKQTDKLFISSMGGMGKSELVKQYAHIHKGEYDAVIFAVCNTDLESLILDDFMLPINNVQQFPDEKAKDYGNRKLRELGKLCNKRVLIIVDNLNDLQDNALSKLLHLNCKMLFTTRCDATEYNYEQFSLGTLREEYVWDIFRTWYRGPLESKELSAAEQILSLYQYHTMAVELIAKQMNASCTTPTEMLAKLNSGGFSNSGRERIIHSKDGSNPKQNIYEHIRRLFDVSELSESQVYVLANLSLLPPSGIDKRQFHDWCKLESYEDINMLTESGWVRQDEDGKMISLHPVVADVMLDYLKTNYSACEDLLNSIIVLVESDDFAFANFDFRSLLLGIAKHIIEKSHIVSSNTSIFAEFINTIALHLYKYGTTDALIPELTNAISFYESNINPLDENTTDFYNTLGILYQSSGQFEKAEITYAKSLNTKLAVYGNLHVKIATAYNNLGYLSHELCRYTESEDYYKKALSIHIAQNGQIHFDTAKVYNNLGNLYLAKRSWNEAEACLLKSLAIMHQLHGERHSLTATIYLNLGVLYRKKKDLQKANEYLFKALDRSRVVYGKIHSLTSKVYNAIGLVYHDLHEHSEAEKYFRKALEIKLSLYGEYHSEVASTYINLGLVYYSTKCYIKAEVLYLKAKSILLDVYGEKHAHIAILYYNFGTLYEAWGIFDKAKENYLAAFYIRLELFGKENQNTIDSIVSLGSICKKMNQLEEAEKYYCDALELRRVFFGEHHNYTGISFFNLGVLYRQMGYIEKAIENHKNALDVRIAVHGEISKETASSHYHLGSLYHITGYYKEACYHYSFALNAYQEIYGPFDVHNANLYRYLGVLYREQKMYTEALNNLKNALEVMQSVYGENHINTASVYSALGKTYCLLGEFSTAELHYIKALTIRTALLGESHESVELVQERIKELHKLRNEEEE